MHLPHASRPVLAAVLAWALPPLSAPAAPAPPAPDKEAAVNPVEKAREGLDRVVSLKLDRQTLSAAVAELGEKANLSIVFDAPVLMQIGVVPGQAPVSVKADLKDVKARTALRTLLAPHGLTFVVVGGTVVVTTEQAAPARQLGQHVSVHFDKVDLAAALKQIAHETGASLALDPRAEKEASAPVSLQVEDVPLETAVRLLSEMAGLKPVRVGATLFVTHKEVAADMRADPDLAPPAPPALLTDRDFAMPVNACWQVQGRYMAPPVVAAPIDVPPAVPAAPPESGDK